MDPVHSSSSSAIMTPSSSSLASPLPKPSLGVKKPSPEYLAVLNRDNEDPENTIVRNPAFIRDFPLISGIPPGGDPLSQRTVRKMPRIPPSKRLSPSSKRPEAGTGIETEPTSGKDAPTEVNTLSAPHFQLDGHAEEFLRMIEAKQDMLEEKEYRRRVCWFRDDNDNGDIADDEGGGQDQCDEEADSDDEQREAQKFDRSPPSAEELSRDLRVAAPSSPDPPRGRVAHRRKKFVPRYESSDPDAFKGFGWRRRNQQSAAEGEVSAAAVFPEVDDSYSDDESDWYQDELLDDAKKELAAESDTPLLEWLVKCEEEATANSTQAGERVEKEDKLTCKSTPPSSPFPSCRRRSITYEEYYSNDSDGFQGFSRRTTKTGLGSDKAENMEPNKDKMKPDNDNPSKEDIHQRWLEENFLYSLLPFGNQLLRDKNRNNSPDNVWRKPIGRRIRSSSDAENTKPPKRANTILRRSSAPRPVKVWSHERRTRKSKARTLRAQHSSINVEEARRKGLIIVSDDEDRYHSFEFSFLPPQPHNDAPKSEIESQPKDPEAVVDLTGFGVATYEDTALSEKTTLEVEEKEDAEQMHPDLVNGGMPVVDAVEEKRQKQVELRAGEDGDLYEPVESNEDASSINEPQ